MKNILKSAINYKQFLDCNIVFERILPNDKDSNKTVKMPVHKLRPCEELNKDLYEEKQTVEDIVKLFEKVREKKPSGLGLICNLSEENLIFLDFDEWQHIWKEKTEGMQWFAKEGWIVYETPRGFRALHLLDRNTSRLGDFAIIYNNVHIGEGSGTKSLHKWTVPPSYVIGRDFYYTFLIYRNGTFERTKYPWDVKTFSVSLSLNGLLSSLEEELGITISIKSSGTVKRKVSAEGIKAQGVEEVGKLDPLKLKVLLYLLFKKAGCKGLEKLMREWITKGYIPLLYGTWYMDIPRSTRMLFEHTVLSIAFFAGASEDQLGKLYDEMVFKHGGRVEDAGDNWENIIHNISRGTLNLIRKGRCPFCVLAGVGGFCPSFPLSKVMQLSRDYISVLVRRLAT